MQIDKVRLAQAPFLLESDRLSLSSEFAFRRHTLLDVTLGTLHQVRRQAAPLLELLVTGVRVDFWRHKAAGYQISEVQALELLGFLHGIGALRRKRSVSQTIRGHCALVRLTLMGARFSKTYWRRPATSSFILQGTVVASLPIIMALIATGSIFVAGSLASLRQTAAVCLWTALLLIGSTCGHELAHAIVYKVHGISVAVIRHGMRIGILHPTLPLHIQREAAVAGPFTGLAICLLGTVGGIGVHSLSLALIAGCLGIVHICSLLPWYGDGRALRAHSKRSIK